VGDEVNCRHHVILLSFFFPPLSVQLWQQRVELLTQYTGQERGLQSKTSSYPHPHLITAALTFVVRSLTTFITSPQASSAAASAIAAAGGTTHTPLHHGVQCRAI
jgi:hypothetical protein